MPFISVVTWIADAAGVAIAPAGSNVVLKLGDGLDGVATDNGSTYTVEVSATGENADAVKLRGRPVAAAAPSTNNVLTWNGTAWAPEPSAAAASVAVIVFDPSIGASAAPVYKTWPEVYAALPLYVAVEIQFPGGGTIPSGAYALVAGTTLSSPSEGTTVTLANGCVITTGALVLERVVIASNSASAALVPDSGDLFLYMTDSALKTSSGGMIDGTGASLVLSMTRSRLQNISANPIVVLATTGVLTVNAGERAIVDANVVVGTGASDLIVNINSNSVSLGAQAGYSGTTPTVTLNPSAFSTSYTPSTPTDWNGSPPVDVMRALDRCAALLKSLNGGMGP